MLDAANVTIPIDSSRKNIDETHLPVFVEVFDVHYLDFSWILVDFFLDFGDSSLPHCTALQVFPSLVYFLLYFSLGNLMGKSVD